MRELTRAFFETILTAAYCLVFVCLAILTLPLRRLVKGAFHGLRERTRAALANRPTDLPETNHARVVNLPPLQIIEGFLSSHSLARATSGAACGFVVCVEVRG